jgi:cell division protein FtsA
MAAGIVMTGGSAKMEGAIELAEEVFHMPVRLGVPQFVEGLSDVVRNPIHATGVGLLLYSRQAQAAKAEASGRRLGVTNAFERMKGWFQKNF